jgi:phosphoglycolate phosphatase
VAFKINKNQNNPSRSIIFDLDGTLIDSQESILNAIRAALNELGVEAKIPVTKELIGPPLMDTLLKITEVKDELVLNALVNKFKLHYDSTGYRNSVAYPGIHHLLERLRNQDFVLYLATNKRLIPTKKIVDYLSWSSLFSAIYSIDLNAEKPFKSKSEMISALLCNELIDPNSAIYIGDRDEDYGAAKQNCLPCILVDWGYGVKIPTHNDDQFFVSDPIELLNAIQRAL